MRTATFRNKSRVKRETYHSSGGGQTGMKKTNAFLPWWASGLGTRSDQCSAVRLDDAGDPVYFMGTSDLWYDVTAIMIALLIPLMAGGLTRKKQPYIPVKSLWMAAGVDVILLALILAVVSRNRCLWNWPGGYGVPETIAGWNHTRPQGFLFCWREDWWNYLRCP